MTNEQTEALRRTIDRYTDGTATALDVVEAAERWHHTAPLPAPSEDELEGAVLAVARSMPGWNDDTTEPGITDPLFRQRSEEHWQRVNAECIRQARGYIDALVVAGFPLASRPTPPEDVAALGKRLFETIADRLGEHPRARNHEVADSGEYETKITGTVDVESLAEFLVPAVLVALAARPLPETEECPAVWLANYPVGEAARYNGNHVCALPKGHGGPHVERIHGWRWDDDHSVQPADLPESEGQG